MHISLKLFLKRKSKVFIDRILNKKNREKILKNRSKRKIFEIFIESNPIARSLVFRKAKKDLIKKTRGFYPAPLEALKAIKKNFTKNHKKALLIERKIFSKLAVSDISKKLIGIFFLSENLKKAYSANEVNSVKFACVLGAGKMGGGIAWLFSNAGIPVRMKDISWESLASGFKAIKDVYTEMIKIKKI